MNRLLRESAAHVFVASLDAPELSPEDAHHVGRVLRVRAADPVTVSDGAGRWAPARIAGGALTLEGEVVEERPPGSGPRTVICATPKGDRSELIVQKLTELGIDEIGFTETSHSVVRWETRRADAQLARWQRIARQAAMQSRRVRLPSVFLRSWGDVVATPQIALAEPAGRPVDATVRAIVIGPEGGFSPAELEACPCRVSLGEQILRVETAAIAAGVLLMYER